MQTPQNTTSGPADATPDLELFLELAIAVHDRIREIGAVDDAILGELRHISHELLRPKNRRAD